MQLLRVPFPQLRSKVDLDTQEVGKNSTIPESELGERGPGVLTSLLTPASSDTWASPTYGKSI